MEEHTIKSLERRSYRNLQQISKRLGLPSNVKKIHLVELIYTKQSKTEEELNECIQRVKNERKKPPKYIPTIKTEKDLLEIKASDTSTLNETSLVKRISNQEQNLQNCNKGKWIRPNSKSILNQAPSDRILRSSRERPNYRMLDMPNISDTASVFNFKSEKMNLRNPSASDELTQVDTLQRYINPRIAAGSVSEPGVNDRQVTLTLPRSDNGPKKAGYNIREPYGSKIAAANIQRPNSSSRQAEVKISKPCDIPRQVGYSINRPYRSAEQARAKASNPEIHLKKRNSDGSFSSKLVSIQIPGRNPRPNEAITQKPGISSRLDEGIIQRADSNTRRDVVNILGSEDSSMINEVSIRRVKRSSGQDGVNIRESTGVYKLGDVTIKKTSGSSTLAELNIPGPTNSPRMAEIHLYEPADSPRASEDPSVSYATLDFTTASKPEAVNSLDSGSSNQPSTEARPESRCQRKLSGISPLTSPKKVVTSYPIIRWTCRNSSKQINAILGEPVPKTYLPNVTNSKCIPHLMVKVMKSSDGHTPICRYPRVSTSQGRTNVVRKLNVDMPEMPENVQKSVSKIITGVKVVETRDKIIQTTAESRTLGNKMMLPKFSDTFAYSQEFKNILKSIRDELWENNKIEAAGSASFGKTSTCGKLEKIYNLNSYYYTYKSENDSDYDLTLPVMKTTSNTVCVNVMKTTMTSRQTPTVVSDHMAKQMQVNICVDEQLPVSQQSDDQDMMKATNSFDYSYDEISLSQSSMDKSQLSTDVITCDVMGDALEVISQDEDFIQHVDMDFKVVCFLCSWSGQKFLHEYHLRREHGSVIETYFSDEWITTYTLDSLVNSDNWLCRIIEYDNDLYILSAKYQDPDVLMASVHTVSAIGDMKTIARVTVYNKVTGEPYSWEEQMQVNICVDEQLPVSQQSDDQDMMKATNSFDYSYDEISLSQSSMDKSQLSTDVITCDVMGDALEVISQDEDFIQHVDMDFKVVCFLCSWSGQKFLHEYHLRREHGSVIETYFSDEWITTYTLDSLVNSDNWLCRIIEYDNDLYILSAKYQDPDVLMASVHTVSAIGDMKTIARVTVYNKVTGEPYSWEGKIENLPPTMPYYQNSDCFKLELSKMDILPNSGKVKLMNRELISITPTKSVVDQPSLTDIQIAVFVKLTVLSVIQ